MAASVPNSAFITAPDGLRLHARCYGRANGAALPVVCLPGLTRTATDFDVLASALAADGVHPRRIIALDYRGRGESDYDHNPENYNVRTELRDVLAVVAALEALPAIYIGTSRGGILTMLLAAARPTAIAGAVLNDIGPVLDPKGLLRIKSYVGKLPRPASFEDGAEILRRLFSGQFPKLTPEDWLASARRAFKQDKKGRLVPTYDVRIAKTLKSIEPDEPVPALWSQFDALQSVPLMAIRGANSDLLSPATLEAMRARRSSLEVIEVPDQGHAPLLVEPEIVARVAAFAARCDVAHPSPLAGRPASDDEPAGVRFNRV